MDKYGSINVGMGLLHVHDQYRQSKITVRSKPSPNPEWGTEPYLRKSRYKNLIFI